MCALQRVLADRSVHEERCRRHVQRNRMLLQHVPACVVQLIDQYIPMTPRFLSKVPTKPPPIERPLTLSRLSGCKFAVPVPHRDFVRRYTQELLDHVDVVHALAAASTNPDAQRQLQDAVVRLTAQWQDVSMQAVARIVTMRHGFQAAVGHLLSGHHATWDMFRDLSSLRHVCRFGTTEVLVRLHQVSEQDPIWMHTDILEPVLRLRQETDMCQQLVRRVVRRGEPKAVNAMVYALVENHDARLTTLIDILPQIHQTLRGDILPTKPYTLLQNAVKHQSTGCVRALLAIPTIRQSLDLITTDHPHGPRWALRIAAIDGCTDCLKVLLEAGANPNIVDQYSHSALSEDALLFPEVVRILLHNKADPTLCRELFANILEEYFSEMEDATEYMDFEVIQELLRAGCTAQVGDQVLDARWIV